MSQTGVPEATGTPRKIDSGPGSGVYTPQMMLRALVVLALVVNGPVLPAAAVDAAPDTARQAGHPGPGHEPGPAMPDPNGGGHGIDCCDEPSSDCDCGCVAPQVFSFPAAPFPAVRDRAPTVAPPLDATPAALARTPPFRPRA